MLVTFRPHRSQLRMNHRSRGNESLRTQRRPTNPSHSWRIRGCRWKSHNDHQKQTGSPCRKTRSGQFDLFGGGKKQTNMSVAFICDKSWECLRRWKVLKWKLSLRDNHRNKRDWCYLRLESRRQRLRRDDAVNMWGLLHSENKQTNKSPEECSRRRWAPARHRVRLTGQEEREAWLQLGQICWVTTSREEDWGVGVGVGGGCWRGAWGQASLAYLCGCDSRHH